MMWGIIGKIFGSSEIIKEGFDLIDDMHTSTEEEIAAKTASKVDILKAYAPFKITQRYLAFMFAGMYVFIMMNGVVGSLYGVIDLEKVKQALDFANSMWLGEITSLIVGFYFGGGFIESARRKLDG
jgi:hypothetical protein